MAKKKLKIIKIVVDDDVFRAKVLIYVNCTNEHFDKELERKYDTVVPKVSGTAGNFVSFETEDGTMYCLWLERFDKSVYRLGVLNHELIHCTYSILNDRDKR